MLQCGLLGEKLSHSYSPAIHRRLGAYRYDLFEKTPSELEAFLRSGTFDGLNVTIPYKKAVFPYMNEVSETARAIGSINTIVRRADETLYGDNTDVTGFRQMLLKSGISVSGKKVLVLGSGGASVSVLYVLREQGAKPVVISRSGPDNYDNLDRHADASVIVNTTPVGMYPRNGEAPLSVSHFPKCEGVLDLIYNPQRTALLLEAESRGIPCENGLYMLVAQAARSSELFTGAPVSTEKVKDIARELRAEQSNIVLIGMPGCGKSTIGRKLADCMGREFYDADEEFSNRYERTPEQVILADGEEVFRRMETEILKSLGAKSGAVIATGGGAVTREENYPLLHQNGVLVWVKRELNELATGNRPLSKAFGTEALYEKRRPLYEAWADISVPFDAEAGELAERVKKFFV